MIERGWLGPQTSFDVAEADAIGQLGESQTEELIPAREAFDVAIALVSIDTALKFVGRNKLYQLSEDGSALFMDCLPKRIKSSPMVSETKQNLRSKNFIQALCFSVLNYLWGKDDVDI
jgi:hypothetical protein